MPQCVDADPEARRELTLTHPKIGTDSRHINRLGDMDTEARTGISTGKIDRLLKALANTFSDCARWRCLSCLRS